jgi:hypothetical protein
MRGGINIVREILNMIRAIIFSVFFLFMGIHCVGADTFTLTTSNGQVFNDMKFIALEDSTLIMSSRSNDSTSFMDCEFQIDSLINFERMRNHQSLVKADFNPLRAVKGGIAGGLAGAVIGGLVGHTLAEIDGSGEAGLLTLYLAKIGFSVFGVGGMIYFFDHSFDLENQIPNLMEYTYLQKRYFIQEYVR